MPLDPIADELGYAEIGSIGRSTTMTLAHEARHARLAALCLPTGKYPSVDHAAVKVDHAFQRRVAELALFTTNSPTAATRRCRATPELPTDGLPFADNVVDKENFPSGQPSGFEMPCRPARALPR